jgi:DNA topoisomerase-1
MKRMDGMNRGRSRFESLLRRHGLRHVDPAELAITRRRAGKGFAYFTPEQQRIRDTKTIARLASLAVPPTYTDVRYAEDAKAHIQAVGRDAAGRLQYRYHREWDKLREARKARRLRRLVAALPRIRKGAARDLARRRPDRALALAAIVKLVERSAIRAGSEEYLRANGTRGAATLLKSDVVIRQGRVALKFRGKGGRDIRKTIASPRLIRALRLMMKLKGPRLFQYVEAGETHGVTSHDVNVYLRRLAGTAISLKDFRTLTASRAVLDILARMPPAARAAQRRRQLRDAVASAAEELANTPAICRRSYVHDVVVKAFESGLLGRLARRSGRTAASKAPAPDPDSLLAAVIEAAAGPADLKRALRRSVKALQR